MSQISQITDTLLYFYDSATEADGCITAAIYTIAAAILFPITLTGLLLHACFSIDIIDSNDQTIDIVPNDRELSKEEPGNETLLEAQAGDIQNLLNDHIRKDDWAEEIRLVRGQHWDNHLLEKIVETSLWHLLIEESFHTSDNPSDASKFLDLIDSQAARIQTVSILIRRYFYSPLERVALSNIEKHFTEEEILDGLQPFPDNLLDSLSSIQFAQITFGIKNATIKGELLRKLIEPISAEAPHLLERIALETAATHPEVALKSLQKHKGWIGTPELEVISHRILLGAAQLIQKQEIEQALVILFKLHQVTGEKSQPWSAKNQQKKIQNVIELLNSIQDETTREPVIQKMPTMTQSELSIIVPLLTTIEFLKLFLKNENNQSDALIAAASEEQKKSLQEPSLVFEMLDPRPKHREEQITTILELTKDEKLINPLIDELTAELVKVQSYIEKEENKYGNSPIVDPISLEIMKEPAKLSNCGHVFERTSIVEWKQGTCPQCRKPFIEKDIIEDETTKNALAHWEQGYLKY